MRTVFYYCLLAIFSFQFHFLYSKEKTPSEIIQKKVKAIIERGCKEWMHTQISSDLQAFKHKTFSQKQLHDIFLAMPENWFVAKFVIRDGKLNIEKHFNHVCITPRIEIYKKSFELLSEITKLPDVTFYILFHDGILFHGLEDKFPMFVMSRAQEPYNPLCILMPDYEALNEKYQVLENQDVTKTFFPWENKVPKLIWRGSTDQHSLDFSSQTVTESDKHLFNRALLCELSDKFPEKIDAKFTLSRLYDLPEYDFLKKLSADPISYEHIFNYKYQILLHGNGASFSCSGWRFFTNSVVFFPSPPVFTQWYYGVLKPWTHYIPIENDLSDLIDKIDWAGNNPRAAKKIALNSYKFAQSHLTIEESLAYLYFLIQSYSELNFVD